MNITEQEVRRVAELAHLALDAHEVTRMAQDMSNILTYINKLNELDTSGVEAMAQVLFEQDETATLRADEVRAPLANSEAVGAAPATSGGYFKVPKVIERS